ncbi:MAG: TMEM175 family protein [Agriterribacter sp.]
MTKGRLEAFSDGVIAIIITIMVLELKVPHSDQWESLKEMWPVFSSYVISFLYVGVYWGNHHHLLHTVKKINSGIMLANLNLLFWLSLIPIATDWMGENHFAPNPVILYSVLLLITGSSFTILQRIIVKTYPYDSEKKDTALKTTWKSIFSIVGYVLAILIAFFNSKISSILLFAVAIMWLVPDKNIEKLINNENE